MLGVFAPAPTSLASLPLLGGVPITLATILLLGLRSSLAMVSLKAGHQRSLTLGIRLSSLPHCLFSWRCSSSLATATPSTRSA